MTGQEDWMMVRRSHIEEMLRYVEETSEAVETWNSLLEDANEAVR